MRHTRYYDVVSQEWNDHGPTTKDDRTSDDQITKELSISLQSMRPKKDISHQEHEEQLSQHHSTQLELLVGQPTVKPEMRAIATRTETTLSLLFP
jgi:hypothetical protein